MVSKIAQGMLTPIMKILTSVSLQWVYFTFSQASVSWRSTLQSIVALSTIKTEYMAMIETIKEGIWLLGLLDDLRIKQN